MSEKRNEFRRCVYRAAARVRSVFAGGDLRLSAARIAILAIGLLFCVDSTRAAAGSLDPSFGNGGIVVQPITSTPYYDSPYSMVLQPDGKILAAGLISEDDVWGDSRATSYFLVRYDPSGNLDPSFGTGGKVIRPFGFDGDFVGIDIALQEDGKIVAAGFYGQGLPVFAVNRYNADGTPDSSFGSDGRAIAPVGGIFEFALRVAIQPDGKIVAAGYSHLGGDDFAFAMVRLRSNGSFDPDFGSGGKVLTPIGHNFVWVGAVLLQPDQKIVIVGGSGTQNLFTLVRYRPDGSLDPGFGTDGKVIHSIGIGPACYTDGVIQADGKIVAVGRQNGRTAIVRYDSNGALDTDFGTNGLFSGDGIVFVGNSVVLQRDGKIVAFGEANSAVGGFAAARLEPNGTPDTSFGVNGVSDIPIASGNYSGAVAGSVDSDGKILAFGWTNAPNGDSNIALVRMLAGPATVRRASFDFDGDGRSDIAVFRPSETTWYLNRSTNGFASAQFGLATDVIAPADFDGDGKTDVAVFRFGVWYWLSSSNGAFNSIQFGMGGDVPVPADYTGDGRAELAVYRDGVWWTYDMSNGHDSAASFGLGTDIPAAADYDGDGRVDRAVYRDGIWYLDKSSEGFAAIQFGLATDRIVPADYDGDGKTDPAVYRAGTWYILGSQAGVTTLQFGTSTDLPAPADYDGDGRADPAVFRPSEGNWYQLESSGGYSAVHFGATGDRPVRREFFLFDPSCPGCWDYIPPAAHH